MPAGRFETLLAAGNGDFIDLAAGIVDRNVLLAQRHDGQKRRLAGQWAFGAAFIVSFVAPFRVALVAVVIPIIVAVVEKQRASLCRGRQNSGHVGQAQRQRGDCTMQKRLDFMSSTSNTIPAAGCPLSVAAVTDHGPPGTRHYSSGPRAPLHNGTRSAKVSGNSSTRRREGCAGCNRWRQRGEPSAGAPS